MGYAGIEAFRRGQFAAADEKLEAAFRVLPVPSLGVWSARAKVELGRLLEAAERYRETELLPLDTGDRTVQRKAQTEAIVERSALLRTMPAVSVRLEGAPAEQVIVTIGGRRLAAAELGEPVSVDPGDVVVEGAYGEQRRAQRMKLARADRRDVVLRFEGAGPPPRGGADAAGAAATAATAAPEMAREAPPNVPPEADRQGRSGWHTVGVVSAATGAGVLLASGVFGLLAARIHAGMEKDANGDCLEPCDELDTYDLHRDLSHLYLVGLPLALGGGVVWWASAAPSSGVSAAVELGPGGVTLRGRF